MDLVVRVVTRSIKLACLATAVWASASLSADMVRADVVAPASPIVMESESDSIEKGLELERSQLWGDAVRHDEAEAREPLESTTLYQRLVISRLHYDVIRRYQDESFRSSVRELSLSQALDLYSEILANLKTHHVDDVDWSRVMIHGTAALEVALTEEKFIETMLSGVDPNRIEQFRQTVHHQVKDRSTATRFDLRANVAFVADTARTELGLDGTATVMEFLGGAVSTLDPYTRLLSPSQLDDVLEHRGELCRLGN